MTIANAIKGGVLVDRLNTINHSLSEAERARDSVSGVPYRLDVSIDNDEIRSIPESVAIDVIDLIIDRLKAERDEITAEIDAL